MPSAIRSNTQQQIDVEDVIDNLIIQKDGSCSLVLKTNAINFGLLSEEEQDATIYAYAAFLNSLTFSMQILIRSNIKDISGYIRQLEEKEIKQSNAAKKEQIHSYKNFIASLITERNVLEKSFYLIIPFSTLELGIGKSFTASFLKKKTSLPFEKSYIVEKAKANLEPKRDHVLRQLARIGLGARQLTTQELIQLLFSMYNASSTQGQKITNTSDYTVPLVQPAYIRPKEDFMTDNQLPTMTPAANQQATVSLQTEPPTQQTPEPSPVVPPAQPLTSFNPQVEQTPNSGPVLPENPSIQTATPQTNTNPVIQTQTQVEQAQEIKEVPVLQSNSFSNQTQPTIETNPQPTTQQTQPATEVNLADAQNLINSAANDLTGTPGK